MGERNVYRVAGSARDQLQRHQNGDREVITEQQPLSLTEQAVQAMEAFRPLIVNVRELASVTVAEHGIGRVSETRKGLKKLRLDIDKERKKLNEGALDYQRTVNRVAKELTEPVAEVEGILQAQEDEYEREREKVKAAKEAEKQAALQLRVSRLQAAGCPVDLAVVNAFDDSEFEWHLATEMKAVEAARAEAQQREAELKAEQERLAEERVKREAEQQAERQRLAEERAKLDAEREDLRRQQEEIRAAQQREEHERQQREQELEEKRNEALKLQRLEALRPEIEKAEVLSKCLIDEAKNTLAHLGNPAWSEAALEAVSLAGASIISRVKGD